MTDARQLVLFRSPRWLLGLLTLFSTIFAFASALVFLWHGPSLEFSVLFVFTLLMALGATDAITTTVELHVDHMQIRSGLRTRKIPRSRLQKVTWESGSGVSVQLDSGSWQSLPDVGNSQAVANSIRAWLKNSAHPPEND